MSQNPAWLKITHHMLCYRITRWVTWLCHKYVVSTEDWGPECVGSGEIMTNQKNFHCAIMYDGGVMFIQRAKTCLHLVTFQFTSVKPHQWKNLPPREFVQKIALRKSCAVVKGLVEKYTQAYSRILICCQVQYIKCLPTDTRQDSLLCEKSSKKNAKMSRFNFPNAPVTGVD